MHECLNLQVSGLDVFDQSIVLAILSLEASLDSFDLNVLLLKSKFVALDMVVQLDLFSLTVVDLLLKSFVLAS